MTKSIFSVGDSIYYVATESQQPMYAVITRIGISNDGVPALFGYYNGRSHEGWMPADDCYHGSPPIDFDLEFIE